MEVNTAELTGAWRLPGGISCDENIDEDYLVMRECVGLLQRTRKPTNVAGWTNAVRDHTKALVGARWKSCNAVSSATHIVEPIFSQGGKPSLPDLRSDSAVSKFEDPAGARHPRYRHQGQRLDVLS